MRKNEYDSVKLIQNYTMNTNEYWDQLYASKEKSQQKW